MDSVCIIHEINCYALPSWPSRMRLALGRMLLELGLRESVSGPDLSSVWLAFPPYDSARDDHDYTQMGMKILGPVSTREAENVVHQLQAAFIAAGVHVEIEELADD